MTAHCDEHCCSVLLIVTGEDLDPDVVTAGLGLPPHKAWRRGERKRFTRPDGSELLLDSIHEQGGWKHLTPDKDINSSLQDQITAWLECLADKRQALRYLSNRGWDIELNCFAATSEYVYLHVSVLNELVDLGIHLSLTFSADAES